MADVDRKRALLSRLSDGRLHSGQSLAQALGISRTAVWKHIQALRSFELDIHSVPGKGYSLPSPIELFDPQLLDALIDTNPHIEKVRVLFATESTNKYLLDRLPTESVHGHVVLAEFQAAGRGRRGRQWLSPVASGLCLSIGWHFDTAPASLMALSLASGVAVLRALNKFGIGKLGLKWPNDIICDGRKLGGILLESRIEAAGTCDVVLGLGLNIKLPKRLTEKIDQAVTDIAQNTAQNNMQLPSRNALARSIIADLADVFGRYAQEGFAPFIEEWRNSDSLSGQWAQLQLAQTQSEGEVLGIDDNGLLKMRIDGEIKTFTSGELSIRALP